MAKLLNLNVQQEEFNNNKNLKELFDKQKNQLKLYEGIFINKSS